MAGVGRKLNCAVVAESQEQLNHNPLLAFQQYAEATVLSTPDQDFHVYPIWPGQRPFSVPFDAVFFLQVDSTKLAQQVKDWVNVCHRYFVETGENTVTDLVRLTLRPEVLSPSQYPTWKQRLIDDYRSLSSKIKSLFDVFDPEATGAFTVNSFGSRMEDKASSSDLQHLYEDIDKERDFKIDLVELESWWRRGRKGESRRLINSAVEKFLPWEMSLREFSIQPKFSEITLCTEDGLSRNSVLDVQVQLGPCEDLQPHMSQIAGKGGEATWGVLVSNAEAAGAAETLAPCGLSESRTSQSVAYYGTMATQKTSWKYFKATLRTAASPSFINSAKFIKSIFQSFTFTCTSCNEDFNFQQEKIRGQIGAFTTISNQPQQLKELYETLEKLLTSDALSNYREAVCQLEGETLRLFWLTGDLSVLFTLSMPQWQLLGH